MGTHSEEATLVISIFPHFLLTELLTEFASVEANLP